MQGYSPGDTIAAIASAPGSGAIGLVRLSGPASWSIAAALLKRPPNRIRPRRAYPLTLSLVSGPAQSGAADAAGLPSAILEDKCVAVYWRAPRSFTGEDICELSLHGSPLLLRLALDCAIAAGARPAQRGEFSLRALEAGKLDLAQAESLSELISAGSLAALRIAASGLAGLPGSRLRAWVAKLTALLAGIEVIHDYAADDLDASLDQSSLLTAVKLLAELRELDAQLGAALAASAASAPLRQGVSVALVGPPNVGKSTLFNALLGRERSLVAAEPGTTRDYVTESLDAQGVELKLVDTAGWRPAQGVEAAGVERSRQWARSADIVLWVSAADKPAAVPDIASTAALSTDAETAEPLLRVVTRCDLLPQWPEAPGFAADAPIHVSGLSGRGLDALRAAISARIGALTEAALQSFTARQCGEIAAARSSLAAASSALEAGLPLDIAAQEIYSAVAALHGIYEARDRGAVISAIFSGFCVGK